MANLTALAETPEQAGRVAIAAGEALRSSP